MDVRIVGVQAAGAAAYPPSLAAGRPVSIENPATMADGITLATGLVDADATLDRLEGEGRVVAPSLRHHPDGPHPDRDPEPAAQPPHLPRQSRQPPS